MYRRDLKVDPLGHATKESTPADELFLSATGELIDPGQTVRMVGKYVQIAGIYKSGTCYFFVMPQRLQW